MSDDGSLVGDPIRHFTDTRIMRLRALENRTRGLFAESVVVEALPGAVIADVPYSEWDVRWEDVTIAVRTTGTHNTRRIVEQTEGSADCSWTFEPVGRLGQPGERRRVWADVTVLAHHEGLDIERGWSFVVVPAHEVEKRSSRRIPAGAPWLPPPVSARGLAPAITEAAGVTQRLSTTPVSVDDLPSADSPLADVVAFGSAYDASHWGDGLLRAAAQVRRRWERRALVPREVDRLRAALYVACGDDVEEAYARALLEGLRNALVPAPKARRRSASDQEYVTALADEVLGEVGLREHRFDWLLGDPGRRGSRRRLPVDAYYPRSEVVLEYRERQHETAVPIMDQRPTISGVPRGEQRRAYDLRREQLIPEHGLRLVVVRADDLDCNSRGRLRRRDREADLAVVRRTVGEA